MNFKVSIIVPCYNQAQYLEEALQSVLEQTYLNWECIIINDGSPDNTEEIAKEWVKKDIRFNYIFKQNGGLCSARNSGIELSNGEFILPLDADDKIEPNYLELAIESFKQDTTLKVVYYKAEKFGDESGKLDLKPFSLKNLAIENMIFCTALFKKEDWILVNGYDEEMIYGLEDWEFWIAILKNGGMVKQLDYIGFFYRVKSKSMLKELNSEKSKYLFEYISIKHADFFVRELGSFGYLNNVIKQKNKEKQKNDDKLKSRKFVIDVFCNTFFGFTIFNKNLNN